MARLFELTTPLGKDVLLFRAMRGREELARLSEFEVSALSARSDITAGDLLAQSVTVKVELQNGGYRCFNGLVTRFAQGGMVGRYYHYRMTLSPWLWFLTRTADCRIFQEMTIPEIVKQVFADHPVEVLDDGLTGHYARRDYCVQYRETDFDFVSRLMEEEGMYYYFVHRDGQHALRLVDSYSGHKALEHKASIAYYPPGLQVRVEEEFIHAWTSTLSIQPGVVALDDYDFTRPKVDLAVKARLLRRHERADYEWFDSPGRYRDTDDGERYVRARIEELHAQFDRAEAQCNVREVAVGRLFTLTGAPRPDDAREYLIVAADYDLRDNAYETSPEEPASYHCTFTALDSRQQFRPARITPRPVMRGPQTAAVVGPEGEEIWTDRYGRVKVQFHWDRYGQRDENSSCWIRVSHPWAGHGWGAVAIPRIGQEVVVDFLEGDPDHPLIVGRVYNGDNMPPYPLPGGAVVSGIKSDTHKGGGYNEFSMDDTAGQEKITVHGQYDMNTTIEHDQTSLIRNDRTTTVQSGHDVLTVSSGTRTVTVKGDTSLTVEAGHRIVSVTGGDYSAASTTGSANVTGKQSVNVKGESVGVFVEGVGVGVGVKGEPEVSIEGTASVAIKGASLVSINSALVDVGDKVIQIHGTQIILQCGGSTIQMDAGKIALSSGSGQLVLDAAGATLKGTLVKIN